MAAEQTSAELTTRDVLLQVDRRLTLMEADLRTLDAKIDALDVRLRDKVDALDVRLSDKIDSLDMRFNTRLDGKVEGLRVEMNNRFQWTVGLLLASWVSIMAAVLLK
jgi:hypothetical protein